MPTGHGLGGVEVDSRTVARVGADREGVIHQHLRPLNVDVLEAARVAVGRQRGFGGSRARMRPLDVVSVTHGHHLIAQRVEVDPREATGARSILPVQQGEDVSHLVEHDRRAWIGGHGKFRAPR